MSKKTAPAPSTPTTHDPAAAKNAFVAMSARRDALPKDSLIAVTLDVQAATIIALSVSRFLAEAEPRARFALLNAKVFDPAHVADLEPSALAASHAYVELQSARAQSTEAKLPVSLVENSSEVKDRMLECAEYLFKRHKTLAKLATLNNGNDAPRSIEADLWAPVESESGKASLALHVGKAGPRRTLGERLAWRGSRPLPSMGRRSISIGLCPNPCCLVESACSRCCSFPASSPRGVGPSPFKVTGPKATTPRFRGDSFIEAPQKGLEPRPSGSGPEPRA